MCPLRIILIFLSATLAGFFLLRNLHSQPNLHPTAATTTTTTTSDDSIATTSSPASNSVDQSSNKVFVAIGNGFWTFVDMASGRYLWKNLVSSSRRAD